MDVHAPNAAEESVKRAEKNLHFAYLAEVMGKINDLEIQISDSVVMLADAPSGLSPFPAMLHLYVGDADASYRREVEGGATGLREPADASDGRRGGVRDAWGNEWWVTSPLR